MGIPKGDQFRRAVYDRNRAKVKDMLSSGEGSPRDLRSCYAPIPSSTLELLLSDSRMDATLVKKAFDACVGAEFLSTKAFKVFFRREKCRVIADRARLKMVLRQGAGARIADSVIQSELLPLVNQTLVSQAHIDDLVKRFNKLNDLMASGICKDPFTFLYYNGQRRPIRRCIRICKEFLTDCDDISKFNFDMGVLFKYSED